MRQKFNNQILIKVPSGVAEVIDAAAARRMQTKSEYIRAAIRDALLKDGMTVVPVAA
jgi:hypothetical protein